MTSHVYAPEGNEMTKTGEGFDWHNLNWVEILVTAVATLIVCGLGAWSQTGSVGVAVLFAIPTSAVAGFMVSRAHVD